MQNKFKNFSVFFVQLLLRRLQSVSVVFTGDRCRRIFSSSSILAHCKQTITTMRSKKNENANRMKMALSVESIYAQFARNYEMKCYQLWLRFTRKLCACDRVVLYPGCFFFWSSLRRRRRSFVYLISFSQVNGFRIPRKSNKRWEFMRCATA